MKPLRHVDSIVREAIAKRGSQETWTTSAWVKSLPGVMDAVAKALMCEMVDGTSELEHVRQLGRRGVAASPPCGVAWRN